MSSASPQRGYAVYVGDVLVLAFAAGAGSIGAAGTGMPPVARHSALHRRMHVVDVRDRVVAAAAKAKSDTELAALLQADGFVVRPTPLSALDWALR